MKNNLLLTIILCTSLFLPGTSFGSQQPGWGEWVKQKFNNSAATLYSYLSDLKRRTWATNNTPQTTPPITKKPIQTKPRITELKKQIAGKLFEHGIRPFRPCTAHEIFVYQQGTAIEGATRGLGHCVSPEIIKLSEMLKNMTEDFPKQKSFPVDFSIATINKTFDILEKYNQEMHKLLPKDQEEFRAIYTEMAIHSIIKQCSFDQLISTTNFIEKLLCPPVLKKTLMREIIHNINVSKGELIISEAFQQLYPTLQQQLTLIPAIEYLQNILI